MTDERIELEIARINEIAADATRQANTGQGVTDDRAICQGLQAITEAILLGIAYQAGMSR